MIVSEEKKFELKQQIKNMFLSKRALSCVVVGKELGVGKNYANKLINEVRKDGAELIRKILRNLEKDQP